ncbi:FtsX-like permease family protein [Mesobaculum littorinae]|uniref:FtsX-like permease family protein n=1 Tax=Mesobaculum littorinae TaxID=2486419 RepID=A0A438AFJ1_9RHOB|nr:FtsX-like permease family protein [Mesobaculum littorinae]RVV97442.1 FtsX-like permease family protein [Mesobaculum littorinae]
MTLRVAARIARRELRGGLRGFRVFLACLALGVAAIAAVGIVRDSIRAGLDREGATLLGGDASVELTYRFADPGERAAIDARADAVSEIVEFRSMAVVPRDGDADRALTEVKGVDGAYPLLGSVTLDPAMPLSQALAGQGGAPGAVMAPILADRLGLEVGDTFRLGTRDFVLTARLLREPDDAGGGFALGPRTLVAREALAGSGLLQPGTLFETEYRMRLPEGTDLDAAQEDVQAALGPGTRWRDSRNGAPGTEEFVRRLAAFLVLVGLAGLAVGGVGIASAVRAHLVEKTPTIAVLKTFGAASSTIFQVYFLQIGALGLLGLALGLVLGALAPLLAAPLIEAQMPIPVEMGLHARPLVEAGIYGSLAALIFTLWPLARAGDIRPAELFREGAGRRRVLPGWRWVALVAVLVAALVAVAAWLSGLARLTLWAALGLGVAFVALLAAAWVVRRLARRLARARALRGHSALRMALASVGGPGGEAASVVLSLGLGLSVLAAIGQIDQNLRSAIQRDLPEIAPSYFIVDIQPDQLAGVMQRLDDNPGVETVETAPMLRGVITQINSRPAQEVAGDHWVITGDRGVTYSDRPPEGARVTAGDWWPEGYDGPPQISFAAEEAAEIGLELGDTLTVNILGRDITGEITSFRDVDFSSAGIGFVLSMNPAALSGAPHTNIATIYAEPEAEAAILRDLAQAYPNITAIGVREAIDRVAGVLAGIAAAVTYGALATLVTGAVVLIGAAAAGQRARAYESAVLKTVGARRATILASFALRSALLGVAAGVVAILAGGLAGWAVSRFVMETRFVFDAVSALAIVAGGAGLTLLAGLVFAWRPLSVRPARVLRARE